MARNGSGTHSLPAGNPVITATTITTTWANDTLNDLSAEITDSLSRSGKGPMQAPLENVDGTVGAPAVTFDSETNSGLYRVGAGDIRFAILAALVQKWTAAGIDITGAITASTSGTATTSWISDLFTANTATSATLKGKVADGASAVGVILDNTIALANASAKTLSVRSNAAEKFAINAAGEPSVQSGLACGASFMTAADQTEAAGTPTNVTGLSFAVEANATYVWDVLCDLNAGAADSVQVLFTGPAAPTAVGYGTPVAGGVANAAATAFSTSYAATPLTAGEYMVQVIGRLINGANAGTVQMQFRRNTAGTVTFRKGAILRWRRIL